MEKEVIDLIVQKSNEMKEGMIYAINEALFSMKEPEPPKKKGLLKRIRGRIAEFVMGIARRVDEDTYYNHYSDY